MENTMVGNRIKGAARLLLLPAIAVLLLLSPGTSLAREGKFLWQSRDQFVAIEKQDGAGTAEANDHPAKLSADRLRSMLASLGITEPGKDKPLPVFNEPEREKLVELLREGLSQAGPGEDVTFAVIGQFPALMGLVRERKVTTGRVFYRKGELNIIFGMVHRDFSENEDRRLAPFVPGSRTRPAELGGKISASEGAVAFTMKRDDWPVFSAASHAPAPEMSEEGAGPATKQEHEPARADKPATVEERLMLLNSLRDKKLITDEEYRTKRQKILDEL